MCVCVWCIYSTGKCVLVPQFLFYRSTHQQLTEWYTEKANAVKAATEKDQERRQRPRTQAEWDELNGIDSSRREAADDYFENSTRQHQELIERQDVRSPRSYLCISDTRLRDLCVRVQFILSDYASNAQFVYRALVIACIILSVWKLRRTWTISVML